MGAQLRNGFFLPSAAAARSLKPLVQLQRRVGRGMSHRLIACCMLVARASGPVEWPATRTGIGGKCSISPSSLTTQRVPKEFAEG